MTRALKLALEGPAQGVNPQVGAVILNSQGEVIGEGFHKGSGTPHAEVMALEKALAGKKKLAAGAIAVVSLEPCNHTGKTGPCAQALIDAGISKVVFASSDPGDSSSGGAETLRAAGIDVESGLLSDVADHQLRVWLTSAKSKRPFVTLKWASSLDGRAAAEDGSSKWISGSDSRADAHLRRSEVDAILVGTGTALIDDPELTARKPDGSFYPTQPLRVVLGERDLPSTLRVFNEDAETMVLKTQSIHGALEELYTRGVKHVFVEGGPTLASRFVQMDLVDEFVVYLAPKLLGGDKLAIGSIDVPSIDQAKDLEIFEVKQLGKDVLIVAKPAERN
ncbi:MAG: bifunctional diaminohydroxyphosphoribosylaminopyrimidine deaminase/5-amino-6-(5-phosphoribosylamino)uracil reductase RibD [Actinobacteria bacterium]|nr:bifunctional diaminohydroxyphosphoribosylaminopyrimidine deaminase/5-amino-6-(5-phosphoribosylamino)uracil reductase RibD [Actinomycetota bacterium]